MKTTLNISVAFLLTFFLCLPALAQEKEQPPSGGTPRDFTLPEKEVVTLDNGLRLVMIPYGAIPKATLRIHVQTGNIDENAEQIWLIDLLADLMQEGSTQRESRQISDAMANMGGDLSIGASAHSFNVSSAVLSEFAPDAIRLMAEVLQQPAWPESELERLKNDMKRSLAVQLSQPQTQAYKEFYGTLYPNHAYGRPYPTESMINGYGVDDIRGFYEENFGALRTTVYVAGKFDGEEVKKAVEESLGDWKKGKEANFTVAEPVVSAGSRIVDRPGAPQSTIYLGLPVVDPTHPDFIALDVTNTLLGASFGSRITSNIREDKGYTYSPYSVLAENYKSGLWYQVADVTTEHTGASLDEIKSEIQKLQEKAPTAEELKGFQNYESGIFVLQNSSPGGIINQLIFLNTHELGDDFLKNRVKNIHAVTPEQVQEMARKYIRPEDMLLIVVGDKEKIENQVQQSMDAPLRQ